MQTLGFREVVLAEDETDLLLFPPLRASWSPLGQPQLVLLSGWNKKCTLFGAVNLRTGTRLALPRERGRSDDFQALLQLIHHRYRGWRPVLLLDSDTSHTAAASQDLADCYDIDLEWLPKRSPQLNPMDHLWRAVKGDVLANYQYETLDEMVMHVLDYLDSLSPQETLRKAGMLSPDFWLSDII